MARFKIDCCLNCQDRIVGCHSECERYKTQRAEYDETMAAKRKKYDVTCGLNAFLYDSIYKSNKRGNSRGKSRKGR